MKSGDFVPIPVGGASGTLFRSVRMELGPPIAVAGTFTLQHGLTDFPDFVSVFAENVIAEGGFLPNERYYLQSNWAAALGCGISADAVNVTVIINNTTLASFLNKTTGAIFTPTGANWRLVAVAYRRN